MKMKVVFPDGTWFVGNRNLKARGFINHESKDVHHYFVVSGSKEYSEMVGKEIAVPIAQVKYFEMNHK